MGVCEVKYYSFTGTGFHLNVVGAEVKIITVVVVASMITIMNEMNSLVIIKKQKKSDLWVPPTGVFVPNKVYGFLIK